MSLTIVEHESIAKKIYEIRGVKVMLDRELGELYGVTTGNLNKAMKRNQDKFPEEFVFQLTNEEAEECSRFQNGSLKRGQNIKYLPYAYSEHGILMLSSVLNSPVAVNINIKIIKVFVELRKQVFSHSDFGMLKEQVKRIEAEQERLELGQRIDTKVLSDKMTKLSREVNRMSEILNEFQDNNLIIKRPEEDSFLG